MKNMWKYHDSFQEIGKWKRSRDLPIDVQVSDDANVMLNGFGTVVNSLKMRAKPYLPQICGTIKWRLNNKSAKIRQQAADLIARIAVVMKVCCPPVSTAYHDSSFRC